MYTQTLLITLGVAFLSQKSATPIFIASQAGHSDVVSMIIKYRADVNAVKKVRILQSDHNNYTQYALILQLYRVCSILCGHKKECSL